MKELTERQKEVLSFTAKHINRHSYPPTVREIAEYFSMSVKGAHDHVTALRRKNCLRQNGKRSRTMELMLPPEEKNSDTFAERPFIDIPLVGTVAAGIPILSEENREGTLTMHKSMLKRNKEYFALKIRGDSMSGVGIMDGDTAIIEKQDIVGNGEIAVAVVEDAVTLKRFYREKSRIRLQAENPDFKPIYCQDVRILGRLSHIVRNY
jgi:repressor LexA